MCTGMLKVETHLAEFVLWMLCIHSIQGCTPTNPMVAVPDGLKTSIPLVIATEPHDRETTTLSAVERNTTIVRTFMGSISPVSSAISSVSPSTVPSLSTATVSLVTMEPPIMTASAETIASPEISVLQPVLLKKLDNGLSNVKACQTCEEPDIADLPEGIVKHLMVIESRVKDGDCLRVEITCKCIDASNVECMHKLQLTAYSDANESTPSYRVSCLDDNCTSAGPQIQGICDNNGNWNFSCYGFSCATMPVDLSDYSALRFTCSYGST